MISYKLLFLPRLSVFITKTLLPFKTLFDLPSQFPRSFIDIHFISFRYSDVVTCLSTYILACSFRFHKIDSHRPQNSSIHPATQNCNACRARLSYIHRGGSLFSPWLLALLSFLTFHAPIPSLIQPNIKIHE